MNTYFGSPGPFGLQVRYFFGHNTYIVIRTNLNSKPTPYHGKINIAKSNLHIIERYSVNYHKNFSNKLSIILLKMLAMIF